MTVASVQELQRAWRAVQDGQFRTGHLAWPPTRVGQRDGEIQTWTPTHPVIPVLGCHGNAGATTAAVALATVSGQRARVLETSNLSATGLAACATAELGVSQAGWVRGSREGLAVERTNAVVTTPGQTPLPEEGDQVDLTVLDAGWEAGALLATDCWVSRAVLAAPAVVLVTTATVPGLRRLEAVLHLVGETAAQVVLVSGPRRRRWPRQVPHAMGPATQVLDRAGALLELPHDPGLATNGLDDSALPTGVLAAASQVLQLLGLDAGSHPTKGHHP